MKRTPLNPPPSRKLGERIAEWWAALWARLREAFGYIWALATLPVKAVFGLVDLALGPLLPALFWTTIFVVCFAVVIGIMSGGEVPIISGYLSKFLGDVTIADMLPWIIPVLKKILGSQMATNLADTPAHLALAWVIASGTVTVIVLVLGAATRLWFKAKQGWQKALLAVGCLGCIGLAFAGEVMVMQHAIRAAEQRNEQWNITLLDDDVLYAQEIPSPGSAPVVPQTVPPSETGSGGLPLLALIAILAFAKVFESALSEGGILAILRSAPWWKAFWKGLLALLRALFSELFEGGCSLIGCVLELVRLLLPLLLPAALLAGLIWFLMR